MKLDAAAQLERPGFVIGRGFKALGQIAYRLKFFVLARQPIEEQLLHARVSGIAAFAWIKGGDVFFQQHDQLFRSGFICTGRGEKEERKSDKRELGIDSSRSFHRIRVALRFSEAWIITDEGVWRKERD